MTKPLPCVLGWATSRGNEAKSKMKHPSDFSMPRFELRDWKKHIIQLTIKLHTTLLFWNFCMIPPIWILTIITWRLFIIFITVVLPILLAFLTQIQQDQACQYAIFVFHRGYEKHDVLLVESWRVSLWVNEEHVCIIAELQTYTKKAWANHNRLHDLK